MKAEQPTFGLSDNAECTASAQNPPDAGLPDADKMNFTDIHPFLRYAHAFTIDDAGQFSDVRAYDHRLLYISSGHGRFKIDGQSWPLHSGMMMLWQPGLLYSYVPDKEQPLSLCGINFDYTHRHQHLKRPIAPDRSSVYRPEDIVEQVYFRDVTQFNRPIILERMEHFKSHLIAINNEWSEQRNLYAEKANAQLLLLLIELGRYLTSAPAPDDRLARSTDEIIAYIRQHYRKNLSNQDLGRIFNFHPAYISRLIRRQTGLPLHQYLIRYRINMALNLLQTKKTSIADIARQVGFSDLNYFSRCFKKAIGVSPKRYRSP